MSNGGIYIKNNNTDIIVRLHGEFTGLMIVGGECTHRGNER